MSAVWYPCSQMQDFQDNPPLRIVKGQGSLLFDQNGKPYLDMISSWWVNLHGHCHPVINQKISQQLNTLEHTLLAGITHPSVEQLAENLLQLAPQKMSKVFFADSGSAAVEIALKMSLQFWQQSGQADKKKFIALEHGYHGETLGSLAVTDIPLFSRQFQDLMVQQIKIRSPAKLFQPKTLSYPQYQQQCLDYLESVLINYHKNICAIILEPLVQGATGMAMYEADYLLKVAQLAKKFDIHVIYDEIAVGFGRTGTMFAVEQMLALTDNHDFCPDFICLSKGLTAGYLPMSCVLTHDVIYQAFLDEKLDKGFLHSHSFTGNPLAAAAALASLQIFADNQVLQQNQRLIQLMADELAKLCQQGLPIIYPRQTGMILAFTLDFRQSIGKILAKYCLNHGLFIRPIGNHVYLMPPYCTSFEQIQQVFAILTQGLQLLADGVWNFCDDGLDNKNIVLP